MDNLFKKLKIKPKDRRLYETAFSHSSYVNEHRRKEDYERLEFLGDAVVDLVVADYLYSNLTVDEGNMTKYSPNYVCENGLSIYSTDSGLTEYMKLGHGEQNEEKRYTKAIVADIFEALLGAIYVDLGYATARRVALSIIVPYIERKATFFSDYKSALQEAVQSHRKSVEYILLNEEGPAHDKTFTFEVRVDGIKFGEGTAKSKKEAEQVAAKTALDKLVH